MLFIGNQFSILYTSSPVHTPIAAQRGACVTTHVPNIHLPNVGRKGHSWLKYMLVPKNIGPINVFLQGSPEVDMNTVANAVRNQAPFDVLGHHYACTTDRFFDIPSHSKDLRLLADALGVDYKKVCYHYMGEFLADGSIRRAVEDWVDVMKNNVIPSLETGNDQYDPPMGHALERMWVTILTTPKKLHDIPKFNGSGETRSVPMCTSFPPCRAFFCYHTLPKNICTPKLSRLSKINGCLRQTCYFI